MSGAARMGLPPAAPRAESAIFNSARRTVTLLVEAGPDARFWRMHVGPDVLVRAQGQGGRAQVIATLTAAQPAKLEVLVGVVDADLDRVRGPSPAVAALLGTDLVLTDAHDLEGTLIGLPALEKLARRYLQQPAELAAAERRWGEPLRDRLLRCAELLGRLRWLKVERAPTYDALLFKKERKNDLDYFDGYEACVDQACAPAPAGVIKALCSFSNAQQLLPPKVDLVGAAAALPPADLAQLCNGHDLVGLLRVILGRLGAKPVPAGDGLHEALGMCAEGAWLRETGMWMALEAWGARRGYTVLAA